MASDDWQVVELGAVCSKIGSGATPRGGSSVYLDAGPFAFVRSQNVRNDGFDVTGLVYINEVQAANLQSVELRQNDVLLNITGESVGRSCQIPLEVLPARVNQHVAIIRPRPELMDAGFLRYAMIAPVVQQTLAGLSAAGATRRALTKSMIETLRIRAPVTTAEQHAIAAILGALDDKIELNRRISETLEEMARAYFDAWLAEVQGSEAEDPSGSVPLAEVVTEHKEKWVPTGASPVLHFSLPAFDAGGQPVLEPGTAIKSAKTVVPKGAVLVSRLNPRITRVWLVDFADDHLGVASTEFLVATPKAPYGRTFLFLTASSDDFQGSLISMATGTSGSHQRVRPGAVLSVRVPSAPEPELRRLEQAAGPMLDRLLVAQRESATLAALRDALLPKLISGELRVPDAERLVSEVA